MSEHATPQIGCAAGNEHFNYRGRFAPSPTGPLHFGSLAAAVGSYLDAKHHRGIWLVRMEDLDAPRCMPGAADDILRTLEAFALHSDEPILYQSQRTAAYEEALQKLQAIGVVYPCCCTRREIADSALHGIDGQIYPGTCRNGIPAGREARAWRVRTSNEAIAFEDALQGSPPNTVCVSDGYGRGSLAAAPANSCFAVTCRSRITQHLENEIGDFVVKRADGLFAYQLAVVADDAFQRITHVVRGADLLTSTPRQIYLQQLLRLNTPAYMHLPVAVNAAGEKLSKQTLAAPVETRDASATLWRTLEFLRQQPPVELASCQPEEILEWAVAHWNAEKLKGTAQIVAA
jgi:glutamyl-Q tRNA(Asp) synthetase